MTTPNLPPEWGAVVPQLPKVPRALTALYALHGKTPGRTCGECQHLIRVKPGQNSYLKCDLTKITHGPGTDWRRKWQACGAFRPVLDKSRTCTGEAEK